jgi:BirA family biotin operon repressor/biotin-[acetyl-CoA-carboxylase] ligase
MNAADPSLPPTADRIAPLLSTRWLGRAFEWHAVCASTSDLAADRARAGAPAGLVIAADAQTVGRGRLGRVWHSPAGENLYVSLLLRPRRSAAEIPPLTLLAGAAVARAVAPLGVSPHLKWPNDVQLIDSISGPSKRPEPPAMSSARQSRAPLDAIDRSRRKLAGVLTEMVSAGSRVEHVVVGIGINANATAFPAELADRATSLRLATGQPIDRARLLAGVLDAFEPLYDDFEARGPAAAVAAFTEYAALPQRCRIDDRLQGVAVGVDPDGALRLRDDAGQIHRVISGEVQP